MRKLFVLDTSVLLFDHNAITNFQEHDIVIPIVVLEELDNFKIGNETKNFEARNIIRFLDRLSENKKINQWIPLGDSLGKLKIVLDKNPKQTNAEEIYGIHKNDHRIINVAIHLRESRKNTKVILVSKDINLRLKLKHWAFPLKITKPEK